MKLDVILPTLNEERSGFFPRVVDSLKIFREAHPGVRVLVCDGGSSDQTCRVVEAAGFDVLQGKAGSRAERINMGLEAVRAELVLFHHPRAVVETAGLAYLLEHGHQYTWGCFGHEFVDNDHALLKFTSWYSSHMRCDARGIVYLDHCPFFNAQKISPLSLRLPSVDIFEDTELSLLLRRYGKPVRLGFQAQCSAVRFDRNGVVKQLFVNQMLKVCYFAKVPHETMNKIYEFSLQFNSTYGDLKSVRGRRG